MTDVAELLDSSPVDPVSAGEFIAPRDEVSITWDFDRSKLPPLLAGKVAIFYCTRGDTRMEFTQSLLALTQHNAGTIIAAMGRIASGNLAVHRNETVEDFLTTGAEWMLMLDDDMQLAPDTIDKLLEVAAVMNAQVVGGLYCNIGLDGNLIPMAYYYDADSDRTVNYSSENIGKMIRDGGKAAVVGSTGCGCLLINREILVGMLEKWGPPMPWFANDISLDLETKVPVVQGEDHTFFRRLREMGHALHLRIDTDITHFKIMAITNQHLLDSIPATDSTDPE